MDNNEIRRPTGVTILSLIHFIVGSIFLYITLESIVLYLIYKIGGEEVQSILNMIIPIIPGDYPFILNIAIYGIFSYIGFYSGYGLWRGLKWVYYLETGILLIIALNIIGFALILNNFIISLSTAVIIMLLIYWRSDKVLRYFHIRENI